MTLEISADLPRLRSVFSNGYFVEGYITADAGAGQAVHATFLGYCGDWSAAPILTFTVGAAPSMVTGKLHSR